ncbi:MULTISPECIES: alpha/beta fold hydrolase [unclassified Leptolyngbya]|uniref:alpha/beta hydrolase n=1 Tax=unclassified Leptolyngbya TaxID=2650499 RepID=UPI001F5562EB|nr:MULTISPECIES: alpha/beta fold hydrolase [unclassified Leptolyngbya]
MKWFGVGLAIALSLYGILSLLLYLRQTRLIFFPSSIIESTPATVGLAFKDVWIGVPAAKGTERIHGWWVPAGTQERGALLYLHGNGDNIGANVNHAARFQRLGLSVLMIDYRGYGQSGGAFPSEKTVYEDAQAAWDYLTGPLGYQPEQVMVFGHSLGGAIAINLAVQHPDAAGLIVQGSFTSMQEMAERTLSFGFLPINWLLTQRFDSLSKVKRLQMPVFYIHGLADHQVPSDMSDRLYEASPQPKRLWLVPNAGHNGLAEVAGQAFSNQVEAFLEQAMPQHR